ncbi:unnamed protein product [Microthlaspi erraticum]|uniref:Arabidopsis retrotransposon Orf1 C-terminal domain-containing protein n=1 Tax=Microthlaspi erraticum TaxID=1685480 RepID=A0A6D2JLY3_9BRAS|nr:unnamed protein product [Microthlaspi erraticum]
MIKTLTKEDEEEIERLREERRTKRRNDPISSESEGEFEIGVNMEGERMMTLHKRKEKRSIKRLRKALQCSLLHGLCGTKYPHVDTMKALGIFEDVELVSRTCTWPSSSLPHGILQGAHLRVLGFNEAVGDLVWVQLWRGNQWNFKEKDSKGFGLQSLMDTLPQGQGSSIRSPVLEICAQGTRQHLLCKEGNRDNQ